MNIKKWLKENYSKVKEMKDNNNEAYNLFCYISLLKQINNKDKEDIKVLKMFIEDYIRSK